MNNQVKKLKTAASFLVLGGRDGGRPGAGRPMPRTDVVSAAGAAGDNKPAEAGGDAAKSGVKRVRKVAGPGSTGGGDAKGE